MSTASKATDPARWLSDRLSEVASAAHQMDQRMRPIIVPSPMAALSHANTAIACDATIRRTTLCQQEICLEFEDAAFAGCPNDVVRHVAHLRRHGFRVSVDMRKSWQTPIGEGLRLLIDSLRVDARDLEMNEKLMDICEAASASGMLVIAENANWRDGEFLNRIGIHAGSKLRTDS
ncbi:EAL domain-containing protein [Hyphomonas pacifica]|nr:EAL domain-containing protein [Hyphomonas pacifica]